ncbi:hypothetical protein [Lactococcus garvieae]|uniref:Uncharacterized protein n=1 Tax=Lactococcus garvieae TaxID=1363 RepID=A0AA46TUP5_9LACT|nr:hypothetical protein [Lactococcus garvieae]UYT09850.1 hypothetical protein OF801_07680 [Lactococcus garvieae]
MQLKRTYDINVKLKAVLRYCVCLTISLPSVRNALLHVQDRKGTKKQEKFRQSLVYRDFIAIQSKQKLVSAVSYGQHGYGRLFLGIIKDLYDNSIVVYNLASKIQ